MSNYITDIQLSGVTYTLSAQTSGGSGNNTVELTQAQYDALVSAGTVDASTYYIITDAEAGDLTNYYTKTETNTLLGGKVNTSAISSSVTSASTNNEIPTAKAVYDATQSGGGGGKAISAGTNISVTTGETADTINCTLPITATSNNNFYAGKNGALDDSYYSSFVLGNSSNLDNPSNLSDKSHNILIGDISNIHKAHESVSIGNSNTIGIANGEISKGDYVFGAGNKIEPFIGNTTRTNYNLILGSSNTISRKSSNTIIGSANVVSGASSTFIFGTYNYPKNDGEIILGRYASSSNDGTESGSTYFSIGKGTSTASTANVFEIRQNGDIYCNNGASDVKLQDYLQIKVVQITQADYDALVSGGTVDNSTLYIIVNNS